jgi:hypothetical protein
LNHESVVNREILRPLWVLLAWLRECEA